MLHDPASFAAAAAGRRGPGQRLLEQLSHLAGGSGALVAQRERAWASATFNGTRHCFTLCFAGAEAVARGEQLIAALPEHEFALPGQLVADAAVVEADHVLLPEPRLTLTCELLLLEDH